MERICGRVFLVVFLLALLIIPIRLVLFGQKNGAIVREARYANKFPVPKMSTVLSGAFQDDLEKALADQMLGSNNMRGIFLDSKKTFFNQLSWITIKPSTKYRLVGKNVYAFDGRDYLLWQNTIKHTLETVDYSILQDSGKYYESLPIKNKYIYFITTDKDIDFDDMSTWNLSEMTKYYPSFKTANLEIPDFETYAKYYFKNDHHWNYLGSYRGYTDIVKLMLGENEKPKVPIETVVFNYNAVGSKSRTGDFNDYKEKFAAYRFDFGKFDTHIGNLRTDYGNQNNYFNDPKLRNGEGDMSYGDFYGGDEIVIEFDFHQPQKDNLAIIGYSDTNAINLLVASHFNKTYVFDPRFCDRDRFEKIITENKVNYLLMAPNISGFIGSAGMKLVDNPKGYGN